MLKRDDVNPEQYKDYIKMLERKIKRLKPLKQSGFFLENVMCEYCEKYRKPLDKQGNFSVWMLGSDMVVRHSFGQTLVPINYCPMCGKKLKVQEVEQ